ESDVYAFVCVCYEIFTEKIPFFEVGDHAVMWHVVRGDLPRKFLSISDDVWRLMGECWGTEPEKRPMAKQIV
ncbi:hypothetical protein B0H14DRAFT_2234874, partial [Mycena olivaceomarginata]